MNLFELWKREGTMQDMLARLEEKRGALKKKGGFTLVE